MMETIGPQPPTNQYLLARYRPFPMGIQTAADRPVNDPETPESANTRVIA